MLTIDSKAPTGGIDSPFRVRYFDNAMDNSLWQTLADTFPTESEMHSLNAVGSKNSLCDRDDEFEVFVKRRPEWRRFHEWLRREFPAICMKVLSFEPASKRNVRFEFSSLPGDGGEVRPHPDTSKKLATAVMYFDHNWDPAWGGAFEALRHKTDPDGDFTDVRCPWEDVETVLSVPVEPRRIGFMLRQNNSLHGVRPVNAPRPRRTITVNMIGKAR